MDSNLGRRLADFLFEVIGAEDLETFRTAVTSGVGRLVGADLASYTEVQLDTGRAFALTDQPVDGAPELVEALGRLSHQHPLITRTVGSAQMISDYMGPRRFRALELYSDVYGSLGAKDQIAINLPARPGLVIGVAMNRPWANFDQRDRDTLELLRPLLTRSYHRARARERARDHLEHLERMEDEGRLGVVAFDREHRIEFASDRATRWLRHYFSTGHPGVLPGRVVEWLGAASRHPRRGLVVSGGAGRLDVRLAPTDPGEPHLLELRELPGPSNGRALTAREHQILAHLAGGETNQQIASTLGVSRRTIDNHLQSIYRKLGVSNRTAAAAAFKR